MKIYLLVILLFVFSCRSGLNLTNTISNGEQSGLVYVIPFNVEKELYKRIVDKGYDRKTMFFVLHNYESYFHLVGNPVKKIDNEYYGYLKITESNRCILINEVKYPLVFDTDQVFGSKIDSVMSTADRQILLNNEGLSIARGPYTIYEYGVSIKFRRNGVVMD